MYVARVREYAGSMSLEAAVEMAITECIRDDILAEFLRKNRAEAKSVSIYEYDEEKHMRHVKEEGRQEGLQSGREEGLQAGRKEGLQNGLQEGRRVLIEFCRELNCSRDSSKDQVAEKFGLDLDQAEKYMVKYWKGQR